MRYRGMAFGLALAAVPAAAGAECTVARLGELPITMRGSRALVNAQINGRPAAFTLDSGAFYSSISPGAARDYGLATLPGPNGLVVKGVGGTVVPRVATVERLGLFGVEVKRIEFLVGGTEIEAGVGLLGQNVLGIGDVEYDLPGGAVRLFRTSGCGRRGFAYWAKEGGFFSVNTRPVGRVDRHTIATVFVNDAAVEATFDTGAPTTALSLRAAARAGVHPGDPGVEPDGWTGGLGRGHVRSWTARFRSVRIGNETLSNVRLGIADFGSDLDMLIGADFFVSHRLFVSNAARRIDFTYTGGPVFGTKARAEGAVATAAMVPPERRVDTADAMAREGAMALTQNNLPRALAEADAAVAAAPREPRHRVLRARVRVATDDRAGALADLDAALALDPGDAEARLLRAGLRAQAKDRTGALADLDAVAGTIGQANDRLLRVAHLYTDLDAFDRAVAAYDSWIAVHGEDGRRASALNGRCWARALAGTALDRALADCDAALRAAPRTAAFLDSRALVQYRRGRPDRARADIDAGLAAAPDMRWSLYLRSLLKAKAGDAAGAAADRAAVVGRDPDLPARAERYGIR